MANPLFDLIIRIKGMVLSGKIGQDIIPLFDTLAERAEAFEHELSALKAKAEDDLLEKRAENSESKTKAMKESLAAALREIEQLRQEIKHPTLDEREEQFLVILDHPHGEPTPLSVICDCLHIAEDVAVFHLTRLTKIGYIKELAGFVNDPDWIRTEEGNKHVVAMKLTGQYEKHKELETQLASAKNSLFLRRGGF